MDFATQVIKLAASVVALVTAVVRPPYGRGSRAVIKKTASLGLTV